MPSPDEASTSTLPMTIDPAALCTRLPRRRIRRLHRNPSSTCWLLLLLSLAFLSATSAQVTIYTAKPSPTTTVTSRAPGAQWTGLPVYDPLQLVPPPPPQPAVTAVNVVVPPNSAALRGANLSLSVPQKGNFLGFSIELSVADTIMGQSGRNLRPEFLNYLYNIQARAGVGAAIRVGGNTQDNSTIYPQGFADGRVIEKIREVGTGPTETPWINYSPELLYTMANVSRLTSAEWYFGLAFNYTDAVLDWQNIPLAASYAQRILGSYLRGLPLGNEPDLYTDHGERPPGWTLSNYTSEWTSVSQHVLDTNNPSNQAIFVGPSTCCNRVGFELPDIINNGWLSSNSHKLAQISVQHYPNNNCQLNGRIDPQSIFSEYLNHTSAVALTGQYIDETTAAATAGKELIMLEMNTASCGGFPGLSTSFGAAVWMIDWALQLATFNFTTALMHVGGQNVYYNPFTPPPGNLTNIYQWTTGSVYYSTLVIAEVFGRSNASRVADLNIQGDSSAIYHPAYAVYEDDVPSRVVLFNYVNDPSGASAYQATISVPNGNLASSVSVRYLSAPTISEHDNITWAGQSMGLSYASDGRLHGDVDTRTVQCANGQCIISVPAPAIAVVYLTPQALTLSSPPESSRAFETTLVGWGSATVDPRVMETSNGQNGPDGQLGRNNKATSGAEPQKEVVRVMVALGVGSVVAVLAAMLGGLERVL